MHPGLRWLGAPLVFIALAWVFSLRSTRSVLFVATGISQGLSLTAFAVNTLSWRRAPASVPPGAPTRLSLGCTIAGLLPLGGC
jgi:hypothetical protein